ncbi:MAG: DUF4011 domain-containing protein [Phycisphaerales bacterium]|nr:DUF4011 domain-containing protein [Phycisphaerales bacterium]
MNEKGGQAEPPVPEPHAPAGTGPVPPPEPLPVAIAVEYCAKVNFALQQNRVPMVARVSLTNTGEGALEDVSVRVELASGEAEPWGQMVSRVGPGETYNLEPRGPRLDAGRLAGRTERERTSLVVTAEQGGRVAERREDIDLLPFDHWGGLTPAPELLAAFVTPNHPAVAGLLAGAREVLRGRGERDAIDGYQSGSRTRAAMLAEACFAAVSSRDIGYISPPASFEREGQRVRLADRVLRERLGTCLDLSLLLAGMWEQAGLNPLVLLFEDHAMPALWTHDEHFPEPVVDEASRLRKGVELGELVAVESTVLTHGGGSFAQAVEAGRRKLAGAGVAWAVDIKTARRLGVRPLPLRVEGEESTIAPEAVLASEPARISAVELAERAEAGGAGGAGGVSEGGPGDRVDRWKRKLLDLSLRNRLLAFRESNRSLELAAPDLARLEDMLAEGRSFDILARAARVVGEAEPSAEAAEAFRAGELADGRVYATGPEGETGKKLLEIYRAARSSIEETGANVLYLALGMLHWREAAVAGAGAGAGAEIGVGGARRAPLILLPVTLVRRAVGGGYRYRMELSSEPLRPNITLLEKLRVDFGMDVRGLDELPEGETGLDVPLVLRRFREAVRDARGWEVVESAHLGLFSFAKFLMWHDLQQHAGRLREQRLVRHLIERGGQFESEPFPEASRLDEELAPGELLCTRDADSSQLVAVRAAGQGRTFVLEGPPGTGKSQTIANIIADNLARGRRVLFVAEKMAALSVVRRRLEQDGLGPFALELHSARASKKEVLRQLGEALQAARLAAPDAWGTTCADLAAARDRLNGYVRALHEVRPSGESVYEMIGRLAGLGEGARVDLGVADYGAVDAPTLRGWRASVEAVGAASAPVDPVGGHPLRGIGRGEWSFGLPEEARGVITGAVVAVDALRAAVEQFGRVLGARGLVGAEGAHSAPPRRNGEGEGPRRDEAVGGLGQDGVRALCEVGAMLGSSPRPERGLIAARDLDAVARVLAEWIARGREKDRRLGSLLTRYRPELLDADLLALLDAVKQARAKPGIVRWLFAGGARKQVRPYCLGAPGSLEVLGADLEEAIAVGAERRELAKAGIEPAVLFGARWKGGEADWDELERVVEWVVGFRRAAEPVRGEAGLFEGLVRAAVEGDAGAAGAGRELAEAWNGWAGAWGKVREVLVVDGEGAWGCGEGGGSVEEERARSEVGWLGRARAGLERWLGGLHALNDWCAWRRERGVAVGRGLGALVGAYERGEVGRGELAAVFERSFGERWLVASADASGAIRSFNARAHEGVMERFGQLDKDLITLTRLAVASRLAERLPGPGAAVAASSEVGILRRELEKRSRHLPTRKLIEALPNLLPRLKPCFLMSPLSVAQYLDPGLPPFDLVVFDEASQIPVWDAIGSVARGADVIVVGDSKQMPPTNFFTTVEGGEDDSVSAPAGEDELESILQECNASGVPSLRLKWHYRSRHESLIAFSNHHYYGDDLHTFPSPVQQSPELGVSFQLVEGAEYDRGGTRTNRVEAGAVVAEVLRRLEEPGATGSIGIVTFNSQQQGLIEDLLDEARRTRPEIERFFTGAEEPVFVKNLENVQGDERDTIIFSVGFGRDAAGRVSMNFGPLNAEGGERRLNVAITRARDRLLVFSSMEPDAIDLSRTRALGVRHFRQFLEFARRGIGAMAEATAAHAGAARPSGFEEAVRAALVGRGCEVDSRVGCAGYRVDLAVRDPGEPGRYLLGIECDGPMYARASTARDRDRTRRAVLRGLGWELVRVWSPAWRVDREGCLARIEEAVERARLGRGGGGPDCPAPEGGREGKAGEEGNAAPSLAGDGNGGETEAPRTLTDANGAQVYAPARRPAGVTARSDIFEERTTERAVGAIVAVVEQEGPVVPEVVLRRLAAWFGVPRVTDRYRERFGELLGLAAAGGAVVRVGDALWGAGADAPGYDAYRAAGEEEDSQRDIEWVPLVERAAAVRAALRAQIALPREDLEREAARLLGVARATAKTREAMGEAVDAVVGSGWAAEVEGRVAVV